MKNIFNNFFMVALFLSVVNQTFTAQKDTISQKDVELYEAIELGDCAQVENCLKTATSEDLVNSVGGRGSSTPLMHAAAHNCPDIAEVLINFRADVDAQHWSTQDTALIGATFAVTAAVHLLQEAKRKIMANSIDEILEDNIALTELFADEKSAMVKCMIANRCSIGKELSRACVKFNRALREDLERKVVEAKADYANKELSEILAADRDLKDLLTNHKALVELLIRHGADVTKARNATLNDKVDEDSDWQAVNYAEKVHSMLQSPQSKEILEILKKETERQTALKHAAEQKTSE